MKTCSFSHVVVVVVGALAVACSGDDASTTQDSTSEINATGSSSSSTSTMTTTAGATAVTEATAGSTSAGTNTSQATTATSTTAGEETTDTSTGGVSTTSGPSSTTDSTTGPIDGSLGCGNGDAPVGVMEDESLEVLGKSRHYVLSVPDDYDPSTPYPVIFGFHGLNANGTNARGYLKLENEPTDAIFVYPSSESAQMGWYMKDDEQDVAYFDELLSYIATTYCVDEERVFATGFSHGAMFSNNLTCWRADSLRAIAPIGGSGPWFGDSCQGSMAAMVVHGTDDNVVAFDDGVGTRDHWLAENACGDATSPQDPEPCVAYDGCGEPVVWCAFSGGHTVPGFAGPGIVEFFMGF